MDNLMVGREWIELVGLSESEAGKLFMQCEQEKIVILDIQCNTFKDNDYFHCHVWNLFCEDYLTPLNGWYWRALEQHLYCYQKEILSKDPDNVPVFDICVAKEYPGKERAEGLDALVERLRHDPDFKPKDFHETRRYKVLMVD